MTPTEELEVWVALADSVEKLLDGWDDLRPAEALVVDLWNPAPDLQRGLDGLTEGISIAGGDAEKVGKAF